jgi:hypothetical protein
MKKHVKLFSSFLLFLFLLSSQITSVFASPLKTDQIPSSKTEITYAINKNLSEYQVAQRFEKINSSYKLNEPFSSEDTEFIKVYSDVSTSQNSMKTDFQIQSSVDSEYFNRYKTSNGIQVNFYGTLYSDTPQLGLNHSYRGNVRAYVIGGTKINSIKITITNVAYGFLGPTGTYIGIVYNGSTSGIVENEATNTLDRTVRYSGVLVAYTYTNAYATFSTSTGSFNLHAF